METDLNNHRRIYKCKKCRELMTEDDIIILYISGREVKRCPFCGRIGTLRRMKKIGRISGREAII